MNLANTKQQPIRLPASGKRELRTQFGALCYRVRKGKVQFLMITSRTKKRWIVPKGWPMDKSTPAQAAAREAFEEAGAKGRITGNCIGIYSYTKDVGGDDLPCVVALYPMEVDKIHDVYPESKQRNRKWMGRKKAAEAVENPELKEMIRGFKPPLTRH